MIVWPQIKQKQPQDRKTIFATLSLPVAKILSPVARQAPTKCPQEESPLSGWLQTFWGFVAPLGLFTETSAGCSRTDIVLLGIFWQKDCQQN